MAEHVEVVVKIPKYYLTHPQDYTCLAECVRRGTILPKGHGDLISKEQAIDLVEFYQLNPQHFDFVNLIDEIKDEKPIIEADTQNKAKENKEKEDIMPYITGATLLSVEEARQLDKETLRASGGWWLRSPGDYANLAAFVYGDVGHVSDYGRSVDRAFGVRPALEISKSSGYKIGESVDFGGHSFTIISDTHALCDDIIGECAFRKDFKAKDVNEYEASDIKRYVETWFEEVKDQSREGIDSEEERER